MSNFDNILDSTFRRKQEFFNNSNKKISFGISNNCNDAYRTLGFRMNHNDYPKDTDHIEFYKYLQEIINKRYLSDGLKVKITGGDCKAGDCSFTYEFVFNNTEAVSNIFNPFMKSQDNKTSITWKPTYDISFLIQNYVNLYIGQKEIFNKKLEEKLFEDFKTRVKIDSDCNFLNNECIFNVEKIEENELPIKNSFSKGVIVGSMTTLAASLFLLMRQTR
ncbi:hypothetical protein Hokovirus_1_322 [Hokovirus HKV1]|uniref:Uncharacterized protein n=1 Tax=Hokovirus HKV1 TaxID=1977638 RepID=A0A1V0SFG6_9VIRU|nr:hypothetical protein Hokovirus_1_322 [Hokovirus HKV1]